ncbi:MAG: F0F1 ATP synthase subunit A, partial [Chloroflexi bacterium]|nr:F0F1 ATP synthase subunit A [Chloroflexota bacterium]
MKNAQPTRRRFGFHRWLVLLLIVLSVVAARAFAPIMPHIQVPAENLAGPIRLPLLGDLYLTNTLTAILLADVLLVGMAWSVRRSLRRGGDVPRGVVAVVQPIVETLANLVESTAGKWARQVFPWVATIVLLVLLVNWMELIPGVDSIGLLHEAHGGAPTYETQEILSVGDLRVASLARETEEVEAAPSHGVAFTPFVRVASTDLNFTIALALTSVVVSHLVGLR